MQAEGAEVSASLRREGERLRLELNVSTTMPCEFIARIDPATTTFVGSADDAVLTVGSDQVTVQLPTGSEDFALEFFRRCADPACSCAPADACSAKAGFRSAAPSLAAQRLTSVTKLNGKECRASAA